MAQVFLEPATRRYSPAPRILGALLRIALLYQGCAALRDQIGDGVARLHALPQQARGDAGEPVRSDQMRNVGQPVNLSSRTAGSKGKKQEAMKGRQIQPSIGLNVGRWNWPCTANQKLANNVPQSPLEPPALRKLASR